MKRPNKAVWVVLLRASRDGPSHIINARTGKTWCGKLSTALSSAYRCFRSVRACDFGDAVIDGFRLCDECRKAYEAAHGVALPDPLKGL